MSELQALRRGEHFVAFDSDSVSLFSNPNFLCKIKFGVLGETLLCFMGF